MKLSRTSIAGKVLAPLAVGVSLVSATAYAQDYVRAFYGDTTEQRVVSIDIPSLNGFSETPIAGVSPYPVDRAGAFDRLYAITRGSNSVDVIDAETGANLGVINLQHKPRSAEAFNSRLGLVLVAGADKPMSSLIDVATDTVVATAGTDVVTTPNGDYGGSLASGHPLWLTKRKFTVIDRANRKIELYRVKRKNGNWTTKKLDEVATPTTVHHIIPRDLSGLSGKDRRTYYAIAEGAPARGIGPTLMELRLQGNKLKLIDSLELPGDPAVMGAHHGDFHPDGDLIYIGSNEGNLFVVDRHAMQVVKVEPTGKGHGHTRFIADRGIGVSTNHKDEYVSVIDMSTHTNIADVVVNDVNLGTDGLKQSHTNFVSPDKRFYYAFATDDGVFFELDLDTLTVSNTVNTGGTPRQGVYIPIDD